MEIFNGCISSSIIEMALNGQSESGKIKETIENIQKALPELLSGVGKVKESSFVPMGMHS